MCSGNGLLLLGLSRGLPFNLATSVRNLQDLHWTIWDCRDWIVFSTSFACRYQILQDERVLPTKHMWRSSLDARCSIHTCSRGSEWVTDYVESWYGRFQTLCAAKQEVKESKHLVFSWLLKGMAGIKECLLVVYRDPPEGWNLFKPKRNPLSDAELYKPVPALLCNLAKPTYSAECMHWNAAGKIGIARRNTLPWDVLIESCYDQFVIRIHIFMLRKPLSLRILLDSLTWSFLLIHKSITDSSISLTVSSILQM